MQNILLDRRNVKTKYDKPVFEKLKKQGDIVEFAGGIVGYKGVLLKLCEYFSRKTEDFCHENFKAQTYNLPILLPIETYKRGGYLQTVPNFVMFQSTIKNDKDTLDKFAKDNVKDDQTFFQSIDNPHNVLCHASCVPIYPMVADKSLEKKSLPLVYFIIRKCFRDEKANVSELTRLNEFTMSEIVFIDDNEKNIQSNMETTKKLWNFWINTFDLNCVVETSTDSFFAGESGKLKLFQLLSSSKQELKLLIPYKNQYINCSSVNFHRTHFSKAYNITCNGELCVTSCIGFGIERFAYAFLAQNGCEPSKWDKKALNEIKKYTKIK